MCQLQLLCGDVRDCGWNELQQLLDNIEVECVGADIRWRASRQHRGGDPGLDCCARLHLSSNIGLPESERELHAGNISASSVRTFRILAIDAVDRLHAIVDLHVCKSEVLAKPCSTSNETREVSGEGVEERRGVRRCEEVRR